MRDIGVPLPVRVMGVTLPVRDISEALPVRDIGVADSRDEGDERVGMTPLSGSSPPLRILGVWLGAWPVVVSILREVGKS